MASREAVLLAYTYLGHVYRMDPPTVEELEVWNDVLDDVPDEMLNAAVRAWCKASNEWPPKPGQLRMASLGEVRVYADASHKPFTASRESRALPGGAVDPLGAMQALKAGYDEAYRPHLRVVEVEEA